MDEDKGFYRRIYDAVYADNPEYGAGHGMHLCDVIAGLLLSRTGPVLIDCGGGRAQFCAAIQRESKQRGVPAETFSLDIHRHDPAPSGVVLVQDAVWDLSGIPSKADVITSFDVLEHLKEKDVSRTVSAWHAKLKPGGTLFMTISTVGAVHKAPEGVDNLHMTVRPASWWKEQFSSYFTFPDTPQQVVTQVGTQIVAVRRET